MEITTPEQSFFVDARVVSLFLAEGRRRAVTRVFGLPRDEQSVLVTLILAGAAASVLRQAIPRPRSPLTRKNAAIGGSVLNAALDGIGGASTREIPLAGALIGLALVAHSLRPIVAGSAREVRALQQRARAALRFLSEQETRAEWAVLGSNQ